MHVYSELSGNIGLCCLFDPLFVRLSMSVRVCGEATRGDGGGLCLRSFSWHVMS